MLLGSNSIEHQILVKSLIKAYEKQQAKFIKENFKNISLLSFKSYLGDHYKEIDLDKYFKENNLILYNNHLISSEKFLKFYNQEEGRTICKEVNNNIKKIEKLSDFNNFKSYSLMFNK